MKKLTCHCGGIEIQVRVPDEGFKKLMRCNCSLCKRKGYIIGVIGPEDLKKLNGQMALGHNRYTTVGTQSFFKFCKKSALSNLTWFNKILKKKSVQTTRFE